MQAIFASDEADGIGCGRPTGFIPWDCPEDLGHFRRRTLGGVVVMGGETWRSLPRRPLGGRINVVLSRGEGEGAGCRPSTGVGAGCRPSTGAGAGVRETADVVWCSSPQEVMEYCREPLRRGENVFVIGGAQILRLFAPQIVRVFHTRIPGYHGCDVRFSIQELFELSGESYWRSTKAKFDGGELTEYWRGECLPGGECRLVECRRGGEEGYLGLLEQIVASGVPKGDRTGVGTISLFGGHLRFDLRRGFPLLTTKRMFFRGIVEELLFFIRGDSDNRKLVEKGVHIWDGNTSREYLDSIGLQRYEEGTLGSAYGHQWRHWGATYETRETDYTGRGVDQLANIVRQLREEPDSRRIILSAWNVSQLEEMALVPCHMMYQFYSRERPLCEGGARELCCSMTQRSGDMFLGVPFNIASVALLTTLLAKLVGMVPGEIVINVGDAHIYSNHMEQVARQLGRTPWPFPQLEIEAELSTLEDIEALQFEQFVLKGYKCHPGIKAPMAV